MNVARMKRRAEEAIAGGEAPSYVLEQVARDVLALLAERERLAEEHDGILGAQSTLDAPQMVAGRVLDIRMHRGGCGPVEVATRLFLSWSDDAARAAFEHARAAKTITLVLDQPSAVRAVYARLDVLLAALRSVDERELPEHVAAALRAANEGEQPPEKAVLSGEAEQAFIDHAREEGLAYAAENYEVNDPTLRRLVDAYNHAGRALGRALGL